jgi:septal ring factor EnvC (AmiA/AmiB activator)
MELYAVTLGKVVYVDMLTVRGGVVVIDHGWGVYTAYIYQNSWSMSGIWLSPDR